MKPNPPVVFLAFANDQENPDRYLKELVPEKEALVKILRDYEKKGGKCFHPPSALAQSLVESITYYRDQLVIFHFAGHANDTQIALEAGKMVRENLSNLLTAAPNLKLVFLNACVTEGHVQHLLDHGAEAVIATNIHIPDTQAKVFSATFYTSLVRGNSLQQSFEDAKTAVAGEDPSNWIVRGFQRERSLQFPHATDTPHYWRLFPQNEAMLEWKLADSLKGVQTGPTYLTLPPAQPPKAFLGRDTELTDVYRILHQQASLLLMNGIGGIGKTTLAQAYCAAHQDEYQHIAWITCDPYLSEGVNNSPIAQNLQLEFPKDADVARRFEITWNALANLKGHNLLVIDNANDAEDLLLHRQHLRLPHWHVLVTTRTEIGFSDFPRKKIEVLPPDAAETLFQQYCPLNDAEKPLLPQLLKLISYHTLLIELLSKSLSKLRGPQYGLADLLANLAEKGILQLDKNRKVISPYRVQKARPQEIIRSMFDVSSLEDEFLQLLRYGSVLPPENIPLTFWKMFLGISEAEANAFEEVLEELTESGWLEYDAVAKTYREHPLIQEVVRDQFPPTPENCSKIVQVSENLLSELSLGHRVQLLPYVESIFTKLQGTDSTLALAKIYLSDTYYELGRFEEAFRWMEEAQAYYQENEGGFQLALTYERLGCLYQAQGKFEQALQYFERRAQLGQELYEANPHSESLKNGLAISYSKLGDIYQAQGKFEQALQYFEKQTDLFQELYEANPHSESLKNGLAISYQRIGRISEKQGNITKGLEFFGKYQKLMEELHQANPYSEKIKNDLAIANGNLGELYQAQGKFEQALQYFEKYNLLSKELYEANPHSESLKNELAISYQRIGRISEKQGNITKGLEFFGKYQKLMEELHQANPYSEKIKNDLAIANGNLGELYQAQGKFEQALQYFEKYNLLSKELYEANPHSESLKNELAISYQRIGRISEKQGNITKGLEFFGKYQKLMEELHQANPYSEKIKNDLAIANGNLGELYQAQGKFEQALQYFERRAQLGQELYEANPHSESLKNGLAISYSKLGDIYQAQGKFEQALQYFERRAQLGQELYEANPHSESLKNGLAISYSKLGDIYQAQGKFEQALQYFEKQTDLFQELYEANPHSESLKNGLAISYSKLGDIDQAQGKFEQALQYFEKQTDLFQELYEANPHSESLKNGLAISYSKLGDIYQAQGKFEQALQYFERRAQLGQELYEANPHSESLKNGLAISYSKLGDIYQAQGKFEQALQYFEKQTDLFQELYEANPLSMELKNGVAISYYKLGGLHREKGESEKASPYFRQAEAMWMELEAQTALPMFTEYLEIVRGQLEEFS